MADTRFICPSCHHKPITDESGPGLQSTCTHCDVPVVVPKPLTGEAENEKRRLCAFLKSEEERLQKELAEARKRLAALAKGIPEVPRWETLPNENLKNEMKDEHKSIADLNREFAMQTKRIAKLQSALDNSRTALEKERGEWESERKQLQAVSEGSRKVIRDLETAVAAASERAGSFEAQCHALNEKLEAAVSEAREAVALRGEAAAKSRELEESSKTIELLRTNLEASEKETTSLKCEIASLNSDMKAVQSDAAEAHGRTLDLKKEREAGECELTAVKEKLSEAKSELEQLHERLRVDEESRDANHEMQALREALEVARAEYRALMKNTEESHSSLAGLSAKLLHSRSIEAALKAQAARDAASLKKLMTDLENAEAALAQARESRTETSNTSRPSSDEVPPSTSGFHEMRTARADRAEKLLEQAQRDAATYAGEAHDLRSRIRADEAALTAANEKNKQIEAELQQLRKEMAELGAHSSTAPATSNGEPARDADETVPKLKAKLAASQEAVKQIDRALYAVTTERDCFETMLKGLKVNFAQMSDRLAGFEAWAEANGVWDEASNALPSPLPAEESHF